MDEMQPSSSVTTAVCRQKTYSITGTKRCQPQNQNNTRSKKPSLPSPLPCFTRTPKFEDEFPAYQNGLITFGSLKKSRKPSKGKQKIAIEFIRNRTRRYSTFCKRKTGLMKKAVELAELTGAEVLLLIASETNHVYTYATPNLRGIIDWDCGKQLIQSCLSQRTVQTDTADNLTGGEEDIDNAVASSCESEEVSGNTSQTGENKADEVSSPKPYVSRKEDDSDSSVCHGNDEQPYLPTSISDSCATATSSQPITDSVQENLQLVLSTLVSNLFFSITDSDPTSTQGRLVTLAPRHPAASTTASVSTHSNATTSQQLSPLETVDHSTTNSAQLAQIRLCIPCITSASNHATSSHIVVPQLQLGQILQSGVNFIPTSSATVSLTSVGARNDNLASHDSPIIPVSVYQLASQSTNSDDLEYRSVGTRCSK